MWRTHTAVRACVFRSLGGRALWLAGVVLLPINARVARAYVSNGDGESVSVLDPERNEVIATTAVGKRPRGLKLSRGGTRFSRGERFAHVSGHLAGGPNARSSSTTSWPMGLP